MSSQKIRRTVWQNLIILAINAGIAEGKITLTPSPADNDRRDTPSIEPWTIDIPGVLSGTVEADHIGWDEIKVQVKLNHPCEIAAMGWLERRKGKWLQQPEKISNIFLSRIPSNVVQSLSDIAVSPEGYAEKGRVML